MRIFIFLSISYVILSCANIMAPTGGPKDVDPPKLINTIPEQGQTNYRGSRIMLEFDELLKLKNPKDEIIVTPDIKDVNYTVKKNIVNIEYDEKLLENTTYSFAFRESIQDLNEGNPAEDLYLAFSTGDEIDSLEISGQVTQLLKGIPAEKYTVAIYQSDTFNIFKHRPSYFTRTDKQGSFRIRNLKSGDYNIYAFEDKNKNLVLESKSEKFGFLEDKITLQQHVDSLQIKTIALDSRPITVTGIRSLGHFTKVRLNKNLVTYKIVSQDENDTNIPNCFSSNQSEIDIFPNKPVGDSTFIQLVGIDSLEQRLDTMFYVKQTAAKSFKEKIKVAVTKCEFTNDVQKFYAELKSTELLKSFLPDSVYIVVDTITTIPFTLTDIKYDTIYKKITIKKSFNRKDSIKWKNAKFALGAMAFTSIHGDSSKNSLSPIQVITAEESATLIIESESLIPNTLVEVFDDRQSYGIYPHAKTIVVRNIRPGSVYLRRVDDRNKNGKWDPGNPNLKTLPEDVSYFINTDGKQQISLRANWEVNITWNF